jgi:DNA-binding CsgD family transcriptional regulator
MTAELVERTEALAALAAALASIADSASGGGRIALVAGEAGIGKTSLLRAFATTRPADAVWWGGCDALGTPHPLAPLLDIAREHRPRFASRLDGPRPALFEAVLDDLRLPAEPLLVVIEDAHWADDATLDLLKYLGRRIDRTRALLAISFRDDEVTAAHPLRHVIGEWPRAVRTMVPVGRLSPAAVELLARRAGRRAEGVHAATQGNAFFVTEVLRDMSEPRPAHDGREPRPAVPASVQDLVLARYARMPAGAQALLHVVAVVPGRAERSLVDALLAPRGGNGEAALPTAGATADAAAAAAEAGEKAIGSGLVTADDTYWSYRHELGRVAVESSLAAPVAQALHARVLRALCAAGDTAAARLVHHALRAGDAAAVGRFAPVAAREAAARSAHREAAAHWRAALGRGRPADEAERREWLERSAVEHELIDRHDVVIDARSALERLARERGDLLEAAHQLSRRTVSFVAGVRHGEANRLNRAALAMIESMPPGPVHAEVWCREAFLRMVDRDAEGSVAWARRALALAESLGEQALALTTRSALGTALLFMRYEEGAALMQQVQAEQRTLGMPQPAALTLLNLGSGSGEVMQLVHAERALEQSLAIAVEHEFDTMAHYARAWLALTALLRGRWAEAADRAEEVIDRAAGADSRTLALLALGRLRTRRGDPAAQAALDEALALTGEHNTLQRIAPLRAARAEAALARGDASAARAEVAAALPLALAHHQPWLLGDLAYQGWRAGSLAEAPPKCAEPFALEIAGRWREAADAWQRLDCPYEHARALAAGDDTDAQLQALAILDRLGARQAAETLRERLRRAGTRGVPRPARGPRATTLNRAFGLTTREQQVLELLCTGLRNAEIADRLHRSVRTVDHHLAAVFAKLGVDSRLAAVRAATGAGLVPREITPPAQRGRTGQRPPPN